jgi:hypothetical protein
MTSSSGLSGSSVPASATGEQPLDHSAGAPSGGATGAVDAALRLLVSYIGNRAAARYHSAPSLQKQIDYENAMITEWVSDAVRYVRAETAKAATGSGHGSEPDELKSQEKTL